MGCAWWLVAANTKCETNLINMNSHSKRTRKKHKLKGLKAALLQWKNREKQTFTLTARQTHRRHFYTYHRQSHTSGFGVTKKKKKRCKYTNSILQQDLMRLVWWTSQPPLTEIFIITEVNELLTCFIYLYPDVFQACKFRRATLENW